MDVKDAIEKRRAYRSFAPVEITDGTVSELAKAAQLTASCFNNQPWRFIFVMGKEQLLKMSEAMNKGNEWTHSASLIIAVFGKKGKDCNIKEREYYLFDIGMAASSLILRATELGLVAHPIAGFSSEKAKEILGIPAEYLLITLINVGKKSETMNPGMSEGQVKSEKERPIRRLLEQICSVDRFSEKFDEDNPKE